MTMGKKLTMTKEYCMICGKELNDRQIKRGNHVCSKSCSNRKRYMSQSARDKMSESLRKPETAKRHREAILKVVSKPEVREKLSNKLHNYFANIENRQKLSATLKALAKTEDFRNKVSIGTKRGLANAVSRKKISIGLKQYFSDKANRKKLSNKIKDIWKQTDYRNNVSLSLSKSLRQTYQDEYRKKEILNKSYTTKKQNGTFNTSKPEQQAKELLQQTFNKVNYQYRCDRYPFNCDFYIEDLDLFIECHFNWTHGSAPYDENEQWCIEQLSKWQEKAKASKFYQNAIYQWTDLDVRKAKCAKDNDLNWIAFYNLKELKDAIITIIKLYVTKEINYD